MRQSCSSGDLAQSYLDKLFWAFLVLFVKWDSDSQNTKQKWVVEEILGSKSEGRGVEESHLWRG